MVVVDQIRARAPVFTGRRQTLVHVDITQFAFVAVATRALKSRQFVRTRAAILTRIRRALVAVLLAEDALETLREENKYRDDYWFYKCVI